MFSVEQTLVYFSSSSFSSLRCPGDIRVMIMGMGSEERGEIGNHDEWQSER